MESGFVYILLNPSMPGLLKIGMTTRDTEERVLELSSSTGVPTPFILAYKRHFANCKLAEEKMHLLLDEYRVSSSREFFKLEPHEAINMLMSIPDEETASALQLVTETQPSDLKEDITRQAKAFYYGTEGELQDYMEAFELFTKAASLQSAEAMQYLARMHLNGQGCKKNPTLAVNLFNKSAKLGNMSAYAELGATYLVHDKISNATAAAQVWNIYFSRVTAENYTSFLSDLPFMDTLVGYMKFQNRMILEDKSKMSLFKQALIEYFKNEIQKIDGQTFMFAQLGEIAKERPRTLIAYLEENF
jgi:TPR repeat protein